MFLTVINLLQGVPFPLTAVLPAQTTMNPADREAADLHRKNFGFSNLEPKIVAMMQTKGLYKSLLGTQEQLNEPAPLANGASNEEKKNHKVLKDAYEKKVADIKEKRSDVWCTDSRCNKQLADET